VKQKPIYLLAGGRGGGSMDDILKAVFADIGIAVPRIAYVGAANGDNPEFFGRMAGMIRAVRECTIIHALTCGKADVKKAVKTINSSDAVFVSGGDVEAGMEVLREKDLTGVFSELHDQGRLLFAVSAGSIMLASQWVRWPDPDDDSTAELFPCLGVAPIICDTHGEADGWEELKSAVSLCPEGTVGYGITSGTCLRVTAGTNPTALAGSISRYVRSNGVTAKGTDLLP